jgi:hypothetical protein
MSFFTDVITRDELKAAYRRLVMMYHPDRGGDAEQMKKINYEYAFRLKKLDTKPRSFDELVVGHIVIVNNSRCVVTEVLKDCFKARSLSTNREAYFSKTTGYAMLNFKFRAGIPE